MPFAEADTSTGSSFSWIYKTDVDFEQICVRLYTFNFGECLYGFKLATTCGEYWTNVYGNICE